MDFIEGLPKAAGYKVILVMVDHFSKYAHFLTLKHPYAKVVAEFFCKGDSKIARISTIYCF